MGSPRVDQINVVVADVEAAAGFLGGLGVDVPAAGPAWAAWDPHHRSVPAATSVHGGHDLAEPTFGIDLDSSAFAAHWGGLPASFTGVVVDVRVDERPEVDELHERALAIGGRSLKAPHDAFWGTRFAVVEGPGLLVVGLMSVRSDAHRSTPPDPATFA
jgi:hypothetical protein